MTEIMIPSPLRSCTEGASTVRVSADSVGEAIDCVMAQHPRLRTQLVDETGSVHPYVALFLNGEDIHMRQGLLSPVRSGDTIDILLAISGGSAGADKRGVAR